MLANAAVPSQWILKFVYWNLAFTIKNEPDCIYMNHGQTIVSQYFHEFQILFFPVTALFCVDRNAIPIPDLQKISTTQISYCTTAADIPQSAKILKSPPFANPLNYNAFHP